jgi:hypothetical protein
MHIATTELNCGYTAIPFYINGDRNPSLTNSEIICCEDSLEQMRVESADDRLHKNYIARNLKLNHMVIYSLLYDHKTCQPVMWSGAQRISKNTCRLFSRYYLFKNYRTDPSVTNLYDKIDNFELDLFHLNNVNSKFPFIFWSRDKGTSFFKKLKQAKAEVFGDWTVHDKLIPIHTNDNIQGIIYTCSDKENVSVYINELSS